MSKGIERTEMGRRVRARVKNLIVGDGEGWGIERKVRGMFDL